MKKLVSLLLASIFVLTSCGNGNNVVEKPEQAEMPPITQAECFNESVLYEVVGTPLKFCYKTAWGEPVVEGTTISFANGIKLEYLKEEEVTDIFAFADDLITVENESQLRDLFSQINNVAPTDFSLTKINIWDKRGMRVNMKNENKLYYFARNAFDDNHIRISGPSDLAAEIDDMAQLMISF